MKSTTTTTTTTTTTMKSRTANAKSRQIRDYNELMTCYLCNGYMVDPTTVDNCGHSFCRSCILKHLLKSAFCPQCGAGGKSINANNLGSDKILRSLIYKLVPGLYQAEKERQMQFYLTKKSDEDTKLEQDELLTDGEDDFFMPTEPISLSLEYHPALLEDCQESEIPPVRYLQCPASVQIQHLKRFLYSKFALDPHNGKIIVEIIYEDEILPDNFMLMDVGYCYNWKREAPMRFLYRILVYSEAHCKAAMMASQPTKEIKSLQQNCNKTTIQKPQKSVTFADETTTFKTESITKATTTANTTANMKCTKMKNVKNDDGNHVASMKVVITRKQTESKKSSGKRSHTSHTIFHATSEEPVAPTNDFKSLRSNDIRFSDYTVTPAPSTTTTTTKHHIRTATTMAMGTAMATATATAVKTQTSMRLMTKAQTQQNAASAKSSASSSSALPQAAIVPIVVSIPQSQVVKSPYTFDENIDNLSLAQLKNACKKSPSLSNSSTATRNVPKLKIELNSLKTKLTIQKPKSADAIIDGSYDHPPACKKAKYRKHSLDFDSGPIAGKVDLETYVKNIGLKPIEIVAPTLDAFEASDKSLKYSPNASPMSSCSSSTTSSSNSGNMSNNIDGHSGHSSHSGHSHKKHKKKHSKEPREGKAGKRRKLHAEISSQTADESLKMKVKITSSTVQHSHKTHKSKTTPPHTPSASTSPKHITVTPPKTPPKSPTILEQAAVNSLLSTIPTPTSTATPTSTLSMPTVAPTPPASSSSTSSSSSTKQKTSPKIDLNTINLVALNKTLGEEAQSIKKLMREKPETSSPKAIAHSATTTARQPQLLPKPIGLVANLKESPKMPASPNLPPSLFKTLPLAFTPMPTTALRAPLDAPKCNSPKTQTKSQPFAVPNPPRPKHFSSAPTSIASSVNKQAANYMQLKRSASLDGATSALSKQQRVEQDRLLRKTAYGPALSNLPATAVKLMQQQFQSKDEKTRTTLDGVGVMEIPPFYAPLMAPFVSLAQRATPASIATTTTGISSPPLNITRLNDAILKSTGLLPTTPNHTAALGFNTRPTTLTPAQLSLFAATAAPFQQLPLLTKSPLDILRLPVPLTAADTLPLIPALSTPKPIVKKLMGPPIAVTNKIRKPAPLSPSTLAAIRMATVSSPPLATTTTPTTVVTTTPTTGIGQKVFNTKKPTFRSSPPALINFRNTVPIKATPTKPALTLPSPLTPPPPAPASAPVDATKLATKAANEHAKSNGIAEKSKLLPPSLREFRPVSKDNCVDILDLSGGNKLTPNDSTTRLPSSTNATTLTTTVATSTSASTKATTTTTTTNSSLGNSLEAALNKMKQSITTCTVTNLDAIKTTKTETPSDDLQNLHLLSESATAREKIAIKTQSLTAGGTASSTNANSTTSTATHQSLYEKPKQQQAILVRHQNASVRNIPNPSALAFRNHQLSMPSNTATTTKTIAVSVTDSPTTNTTATTTTTTTTTTGVTTNENNVIAKALPKIGEKSTINQTTSTSASTVTATTTTTTAPQTRPTKKLTTIDQVAATLNIRAAAAEASAARAASAAAAAVENNALSLTPSTTATKTTAVTTTSSTTTALTTATTTATTTTTAGANSTAVKTTKIEDSNVASTGASTIGTISTTISTPKTTASCDTTKPTVTPSTPIVACKTAETSITISETIANNNNKSNSTNNNTNSNSSNNNNNNKNNNNISSNNNDSKNNNCIKNANTNTNSTTLNNNKASNNNNSSINNNNNNNTNNNINSNSISNNINNITPASVSAPLSTPLSSSSSTSSSSSSSTSSASLLSESNQTSLVVQGSI